MRPLPARTAGEWSFGLVLTPPASWTVAAHFLTVDEEVLELNGMDTHCAVQALLPSASAENRADRPPASERVWIRGRPVRFSALGQDSGSSGRYAGTGSVTITCEGSGADRASSAEIFVFAGLFDKEEFSGADWTAREVVEVNGTAAQVYVNDVLVALCLPASAPDQVCVGSDINDEVVEPNDIDKRARVETNHRRVRAVAEGMTNRAGPERSEHLVRRSGGHTPLT